jgi:hypothetical protein
MAFRNPLRHLPSTAITGPIPGSQISGAVAQATNATTAGSATSVTGPVAGAQITGTVANATNAATAAAATAVTGVGTVPYTALAVGTGNLAPDPSFEGAYALTLQSGSWTVDTTTGNQSPKSLKVTTVNGNFPTKTIATVPVIPSERYYLAVDYKVSSDWAGTGVNVHLDYRDGSGTSVGSAVAGVASPVLGGAFQRVTLLTNPVPANAVTAKINVQHAGSVTNGSVWFDNIEVRTAIVAGAIAAGIISAGMLAATAIDGKTITGAVLQTAAAGNRVVVTSTTRNSQSVGQVNFYTEVASDTPGGVTAYGPADGTLRSLNGTAPAYVGGPAAPFWKLSYEDTGLASRFDVGADTAYVNKLRVATTANIISDASVGGILSAGNLAWGRATVTIATANTAASVTVTGLAVTGTTFQCLTAPLGASLPVEVSTAASSITSTSAIIWANRSTTGTQQVSYLVIGV